MLEDISSQQFITSGDSLDVKMAKLQTMLVYIARDIKETKTSIEEINNSYPSIRNDLNLTNSNYMSLKLSTEDFINKTIVRVELLEKLSLSKVEFKEYLNTLKEEDKNKANSFGSRLLFNIISGLASLVSTGLLAYILANGNRIFGK